MRTTILNKLAIMTVLMLATPLAFAYADNDYQGPGQIYVFGTGPYPTAISTADTASNTHQANWSGATSESPGAIYIYGTVDPDQIEAHPGNDKRGFKMASGDKCTDSPGSVYVLGTDQEALAGAQCG